MADYKVTDTQLGAIADAIRTKGGTSAQLSFPTGFTNAIGAIPSGGTLVTKTITENGTYDPEDDNADGYSEVTVNVSGGGGGMIYHKELTPIKTDVNKGIVSNGRWVPQENMGRISDVFEVDATKKYLVHYGAVGGDRLRVATFQQDPTDSTQDVSGQDVYMDDNSGSYGMIRAYTMFSPRTSPLDTCLVITKSVNGTTGLKVHVIEFDDNGY